MLYKSNIIEIEENLNDVYPNCINNNIEGTGLLSVKKCNTWITEANKRPVPKMLFSEFWSEGELCILFADTNLGKSALAVQIGNSISKAQNIMGFKLEAVKQPVLYCDFELSDKQFEARYSKEYESHYTFDSYFFRAEIDPYEDLPEKYETFEDFLAYSLECAIEETDSRIVIIDNITYLKHQTEKARDALPLMKQLKAIKSKYNLSILVLAHTPKRDLSRSITQNDLQGSKMLINFCDSAFAIGQSHTDINIRYLKQIKARNTEMVYDTENVCLCQIDKPDNFLQFEYIDVSRESVHLRQLTEKDNRELCDKVLELNNIGKSLRNIASELGISHMKAKRIIDKYETVTF